MKSKIVVLFAISILAVSMSGQVSPASQPLSLEAKLTKNIDGKVVVTTNSIRPLWLVVEKVSRQYGWVVDYEDPIYPPEQITRDSSGDPVLVLTRFTSTFSAPKDSSTNEKQRVLESIVNQFNAQSPLKFSVRKLSDTRFDIAPETKSLLDIPVQIDDRTRSLSAEVDAVMEALTRATGYDAGRGGLIDNVMENETISIKHSQPVPARQLLYEIVDHSPVEKVWGLTCDPDGYHVNIGFQSAVLYSTDSTMTLIRNPKFAASNK